MSIKRRIWALPVISAIIFGLGVAVSASISTRALNSIQMTENVDFPALSAAKGLAGDIQAVTDGLRDAVSEGDKARVTQIGEQANKVRARLADIGKLEGMQDSAARLGKDFDDYYAPALSAAKIMLDLEQGDPQAVVGRMQKALTTLNGDVAKFTELTQRQFKDGLASSATSVRRVLTATILTALIVIATLAIVSWFVVRTIWQQLGGEPEYARDITRAVAAGDLSMEIRTDADDHASLLAALKDMRARLSGMVADIKTSAETISTASSEIASGNADLASRTESQAGSLEHTTRAMESLTDTVRANAASAGQANQLVMSASEVATRGGQVVGNVVATMGAINDSAKQIVEIISVIDGIAFQTNILALNAAVEAARAGEQGRGFAVVASEVRSLAQRSAAAAKEIKQLIGDSVSKINAGTVLVDEAGSTMEQIVTSVRTVHDIMAEIAQASQRQSDGIEQIGRAIGAMDEMTQQNSALVEEASAAAVSLTEQTGQLTEVLAVFKLNHALDAPMLGRPQLSLALAGNAR
ncbi:methyl-accepting chemotaxis protein [Massilia sp. 9096]|uniref:methyl-accepting chemotaxis protein n=1 Tax=Massilia sp. 9096 TaxID=1500894 RepID=UPI0009DF1430|nr:methyl-accepting chemotaxis protein [Massilia sp. 9096]